MAEKHCQVQSSTYLEAVKHRRTVYGLTDNVSVSDDRIVEIVNEVIQTCPSPWNMQSTRILVTLGKENKRLWNTVIAGAKPFVLEQQGEEDWNRYEDRFKSFQAAYGTIFVFEDHTAIEKMHQKFPKFPITVFEGYAEHSDAMHQITLWTAVELEGLGANLQHSHFVPGVERSIRSAFSIPSAWSIKAQIVFGALSGKMPIAPEKLPVSDTVKVYK
ncbi:uncharacterized protein PFLUO_LOCUS7274 [Penicillium psychrofluorescens]|uniref:uncharacterized protein n=1 Tax=Penicillium psychrofluorescens TaxID=3158075 RepID=UPI003CCDD58F